MNASYTERYPELAALLHLAAPEPLPQIPVDDTVPEEKTLYVAGLDRSERFLSLREWLAEGELHFVEHRLGAFAALLEKPYAKELIAHPNVHLHYTESGEEIVPPAHFAVEGSDALEKRLWETRQLRRDILGAPILFSHVRKNLSRLARSFRLRKGAFTDLPAVICGAGPSLRTDLTGSLLFAAGTAFPLLSQRGIEPHFAVAFDPNTEEIDRFVKSEHFTTPLLYGARLHPGVFSLGNYTPGYIPSRAAGLAAAWLESALGIDENLLAALSDKAQTSVAAALALADYCGCRPIYLSGVDLAYKGGQRYLGDKGAAPTKGPIGDPLYREGDLITTHTWRLERDALAAFAKERPYIYNLSDGLPIPNIPRAEYTIPRQRDLSGLVHKETQRLFALSAKEPLERLRQSALRTLALLDKWESSEKRELLEWQIEEEPAYTLFVQPFLAFGASDLSLRDYLLSFFS